MCILQVEYDLTSSTKDDLRLTSTDRIEQSAVPQCMAWYPPITKEHFIVTANDQVYRGYFNPCPAELIKMAHIHFSLFSSEVRCMISIDTVDPLTAMETVQILISWLLMKPADLDLHCFLKTDNHKPADQDLHCFLEWNIYGFSRTRVKFLYRL